MARPKKDGSSLLPSVTIQPSAAVAAFSAIERELAGVTPVEAVPDDHGVPLRTVLPEVLLELGGGFGLDV